MVEGARGVVAVTGGGSGIGLACARLLAAEGWTVAVADRDPAAVKRAAGALGAGHLALALDVTDEGEVEGFAEAAAALGEVRGVVTAAGIARSVPFLETTAADFRAILEVNVIGTFLPARALASRMAPGGAIVTFASVSGLRGNLGRAAYGASKGAVVTLTKVMAVELAARGLRVNAVAPGPVDTPMVAALHTASARASWTRRVPMGRYAAPEEMAGTVAFLLDGARSGYLTGQVIAVDGGFAAAGLLEE